MTITRHKTDFAPLDDETRRALDALDTTLLSDAMFSGGTMTGAIKPVRPGMPMVGQARTVFCPGTVEAAICTIALGNPGEVLVIDGGGGVDHASLGGIMAFGAAKRGYAGCVVDGAVRDIGEIRGRDFPVYARGATPHGAGFDPRGIIDGPIIVGGIRVVPGDVIVGDDDGVVVIPQTELREVIARAQAKMEKEAGWIAQLESGKTHAEVHGFTIPPATTP